MLESSSAINREISASRAQAIRLRSLAHCEPQLAFAHWGMSWRKTLNRWWQKLYSRETRQESRAHLRRGLQGERAAQTHLERQGLRFILANFRSKRGEIDLIFTDDECVVFVEVKTRSSIRWKRPADAVNWTKKRRLSRAALDYLRALKNPRVAFRFDIVEVILSGDTVREIRHIKDAFRLTRPYRYG